MVSLVSAVARKRFICAGAAGAVGAAMLTGVGVAGAAAQLTSPMDLPDGANITYNGTGAQENSGRSLSNAGDVNGDNIDDIIIGAPDASNNSLDHSGSSYIVYGGGSPISSVDLGSLDPSTTGLQIYGAAAEDHSGSSVSGAGDVNGDGLDDVIVGAPVTDINGPDSGSAYIVYGQPNIKAVDIDLADALDPATTGLQIDGSGGDELGFSVSAAGDVNGDGLDDVVAGAPWSYQGGDYFPIGSSFIIFGQSPDNAVNIDLTTPLVPSTTGLRIDAAESDPLTNLGWSVSGAGDINGDGLGDVIIGGYQRSASYGPFGPAATYVVYGTPPGDAANIDLATPLNPANNGFRIDGAAADDYAGIAVSGAGDVNGDNLDDLIIGAPGPNVHEGATTPGSAYIVYGSPEDEAADINLADTTLDPATTGLQIEGAVIGDANGWSVSGAGDVNGDNLDDVIVGAWHASPNGLGEAGSASVVYGSKNKNAANVSLATPLNPATTGFQMDGTRDDDHVGTAVSGAGDINGDGLDDVIASAPYTDVNGSGSGSTYVIYGESAPEPPPIPVPAAQVPLKNCVKIPVDLPINKKRKLTKPRCKTTAGQAVKVNVRVKGASKRGDIRVYKLIRKKNGKTLIRTYRTRAKIVVVWKAPATDGFKEYRTKKTYKIGRSAKRQLVADIHQKSGPSRSRSMPWVR
ncbi:MAG: FG-GAP repeat protein [Actinobacteria bacterium]|nr:FG-GAP repeat protein [Actinomycetota bacterium]